MHLTWSFTWTGLGESEDSGHNPYASHLGIPPLLIHIQTLVLVLYSILTLTLFSYDLRTADPGAFIVHCFCRQALLHPTRNAAC